MFDPIDYQFVEEENSGLPKVNILVSPSVVLWQALVVGIMPWHQKI